MCSVVLGILVSCATSPGEAEIHNLMGQKPDPSLSPQEVVSIQLEAFRNNTEDNEGIAVAFRFASPVNRRQTGPLTRFAGMMQGSAYRVMMEYDSLVWAPTVVDGNTAIQRVALIRDGETFIYDFILQRQTVEPYTDCWMTEGVRVILLPRRQLPSPERSVPLEGPTLNV